MQKRNSAETYSRTRKAMNTTLISVLANAALAIVKIISGVLGHSYALIADGIESTTDIFSAVVVWGGLKIAAKPPDTNHPFGHGKAEPLAAIVVAMGLLGAAIGMAIQSVRELITPHHAPAPFTLFVLLAVVISKELLFRFIFTVSEELDSTAVKVDAWHHRSDALTSAAAFVGISVAVIMGEGYEGADDWAALLACGIIFANGYRLFRMSIGDVMDAAPAAALVQSVRNEAGAVKGVLAIEKCRVRKSGLAYHVDIHVEVDGQITVQAGHEIAHRVQDRLCACAMGISDVIVHIEPRGSQNSPLPT